MSHAAFRELSAMAEKEMVHRVVTALIWACYRVYKDLVKAHCVTYKSFYAAAYASFEEVVEETVNLRNLLHEEFVTRNYSPIVLLGDGPWAFQGAKMTPADLGASPCVEREEVLGFSNIGLTYNSKVEPRANPDDASGEDNEVI